MKKILFIVPPYVSYDSFMNPAFNERAIVKKNRDYGSVVTDMPLGLLSLSSFLKKNAAVEIKLIDFNIVLNKIEDFSCSSFSDLFNGFLSAKEWIDYSPDIIGISALFTTSYYNMIDVAQAARRVFPMAIIIAGGGVPTNMYGEIFRDTDSINALCYGEGEKPLLGLVTAPDNKEFLNNHKSWITKEKSGKSRIFQYDFIEDLDEIPFYDYGILNADEYGLSPTIKTYASFDDKANIFHMSTSRGCPHHCCFCSSHTVHGRRMRYHSVSRVEEDLRRLQKEFGARRIGFQDDNFMADKERARSIINIVKKFKMAVFFQSGLPLYALDRQMLEALKDAGLKQLVLAIESGSQRVLTEIMHKPTNLSMAKQVIADCRELGLDTDANILIGLPGETKQDIEDTREFLKTLDATWFRIYIATPLVGSEMFGICAKNNYLKGSYIGCDFKKAVIETEDFTPEYIQEKAYSLNLELNFVRNSDFRLKNYEIALKGFENTLKIKSDHAFALYFAAKCCKIMGQEEKYLSYKARYQQIIDTSAFWKEYAGQFKLGAIV